MVKEVGLGASHPSQTSHVRIGPWSPGTLPPSSLTYDTVRGPSVTDKEAWVHRGPAPHAAAGTTAPASPLTFPSSCQEEPALKRAGAHQGFGNVLEGPGEGAEALAGSVPRQWEGSCFLLLGQGLFPFRLVMESTAWF